MVGKGEKALGYVAVGGMLLLSVILVPASLRTVPAGHLGLVTTFGHVSPETLSPGMHLTNPAAIVKVFSTKTTLFEQTNTVPTQEGLMVGLDVALLFRVRTDSIYDLYTKVGEDFVNVLIAPQLASEVRAITSQHEAKELYGVGRELISSNLTIAMESALEPRGIEMERVLLKEVSLPALLRESIEAKAQAEQAAERMRFVLAKEEQEADRKAIEARGIAGFQRIVSEGITPSLLQWKGIEATEKFAESSSSKIVIMGNSKASLPVMFSGDVAKDEL